MNNQKLVFIFIGILIGGLSVWLFMSGSVNYPNWNKPESQITNRNGMMGSEIDAHFIEQMIPHHDDAITMAKLALEKGTRPEIKTLAQNIISSQTAENSQMRTWYKEWFSRELPEGDEVMNTHGMMSGSRMHMGVMGDSSDLENLSVSADFDKEFIKQMIPHHQSAVMMASMLKRGTNRPEMEKLADDIIEAQTNEIDQMRSWLKTW